MDDILTGTERADYIQALIDAATFLTTHPDVPVSAYATTHIWYLPPRGDVAAARDLVDGAAALAGVGAADDGASYAAERVFGQLPGRVTYRATAADAAISAASAQAPAEITRAAA